MRNITFSESLADEKENCVKLESLDLNTHEEGFVAGQVDFSSIEKVKVKSDASEREDTLLYEANDDSFVRS